MTISIIRKTTKQFAQKEGEPHKESESKEKILCEFKTDDKTSSALLEMVNQEMACPNFNNGDLEFEKWIDITPGKVDEILIIKFTK